MQHFTGALPEVFPPVPVAPLGLSDLALHDFVAGSTRGVEQVSAQVAPAPVYDLGATLH